MLWREDFRENRTCPTELSSKIKVIIIATLTYYYCLKSTDHEKMGNTDQEFV